MGESPLEISFGTLRICVSPTVYEPSEDSFLLATYASSCRGRILEVGCGTGVASLSAAQANAKNEVLGVDINPAAVECARRNAKLNKIRNAAFLQSDLFSLLAPGEKFDAILFNPPYLPTTREEKLKLEGEMCILPKQNASDIERSSMLNAAYDGGESGLETFTRFAKLVPNHLPEGGKAAVIATSLNGGIKQTLAELESRVGTASILAEESFFFEKIALIEAVKR